MTKLLRSKKRWQSHNDILCACVRARTRWRCLHRHILFSFSPKVCARARFNTYAGMLFHFGLWCLYICRNENFDASNTHVDLICWVCAFLDAWTYVARKNLVHPILWVCACAATRYWGRRCCFRINQVQPFHVSFARAVTRPQRNRTVQYSMLALLKT